MSPPPSIGFQQTSGLRRLLWRREVAPVDDKLFLSLKRRGLADGIPCDGGCEWRITAAGCAALGFTIPDDDEETTELTEQAA